MLAFFHVNVIVAAYITRFKLNFEIAFALLVVSRAKHL